MQSPWNSARVDELRLALTTVACVALTAGCGDPLKEGQRIEELRVLGARIEVLDESGEARLPSLATPRAGDDFRIEVLARDPGGAPVTSWALVACRAEETLRGIPRCAEEPFARSTNDVLGGAAPELIGRMPGDVEPGTRMTLLGVVCERGAPVVADRVEEFGCDDPSGATIQFDFDFFVGGEDEENENPDVDPVEITWDGDPWPAVDVCDDDGALVLSQESRHEIRLELPAAARELTEATATHGPEFETLQISHFSTAGALDRQYTALLPDQEELSVEVPWKAPRPAPSEPVTFTFVVRDLRGGITWFERQVCPQP